VSPSVGGGAEGRSYAQVRLMTAEESEIQHALRSAGSPVGRAVPPSPSRATGAASSGGGRQVWGVHSDAASPGRWGAQRQEQERRLSFGAASSAAAPGGGGGGGGGGCGGAEAEEWLVAESRPRRRGGGAAAAAAGSPAKRARQ